MSGFDVSVGISPRQSFDSWATFMGELERDGVNRIWVIDSQLAMKDVYAGLVVAALNTTRVGLGTGVTNAVTRHPTVTANAIAAVDERLPEIQNPPASHHVSGERRLQQQGPNHRHDNAREFHRVPPPGV